jgi:hypothetical protein
MSVRLGLSFRGLNKALKKIIVHRRIEKKKKAGENYMIRTFIIGTLHLILL